MTTERLFVDSSETRVDDTMCFEKNMSNLVRLASASIIFSVLKNVLSNEMVVGDEQNDSVK